MRYFFIDESGDLTSKNLDWFLLGGYHISKEEYSDRIPRGWRTIRQQHNISQGQEIKCADLMHAYWQLSNGNKPRQSYLQRFSIDEIINITKEIIGFIQGLDTMRIIVAACRPKELLVLPWTQKADGLLWKGRNTAVSRCLGMLLQELMQRFEFDLRKLDQEGTMHFDRLPKEHEESLQNFFNRLVDDRIDSYVQYRKLVGPLSFQETDTQHGMQLVDYVCGFCWGFLCGKGFQRRTLVDLRDKIRKGPSGQVLGYGFVIRPLGAVGESFFKDLSAR